MANHETASPALSTRASPDGEASPPQRAAEGASIAEVVKDSAATATPSPPPVSAQNSTEPTLPQPASMQPPKSSLVPLGSSPSAPATMKKFSAVNVNKKFLEKTAQTASATASSTASAKTSSAAARPATTSTPSHSRLVTAKLTAIPTSSTAGWSRPASVAPPSSTANNSPNSTSPLPTSAIASNGASVAPKLPHAGKVIQPQPNVVGGLSHSSMKEPPHGSKPVWGNISSAPVRLDIPVDDFPTAAEVAKGSVLSSKKPQAEEGKVSADVVKDARMEDADAFRGVHLDPNAHHWDEMEEDDDDFLGGVVEFGDGRQYKVESVDGRAEESLSTGSKPDGVENVRDRFVDDFDRSWPKSKSSPATLSQDLPSPHEAIRSPATSVNGLYPSPVDSSRVLFNERSNRLEPYSHSRQGQPLNAKRSSFHDPDGRNPRDFGGPPHNVHVLQKSQNGDFGARNRRFSGASNSSATPVSPRENHFPRRDGPPASPRMVRDGGHLIAPSTSHGGRERDGNRRGSMGPPPIPPRAFKTAQESGRHLPPHLTQSPPARREPRTVHNEPPTPASTKAPSLPSHSPLSVHAQLSAMSPVIGSVLGLPLPLGTDLEEVRKDVMHNAAARAKQRREQEEAERESQKERARRKAQELEEKMKREAEFEKANQKEPPAIEANRHSVSQSSPSQNELVNSIIEDAVKCAHPANSRSSTSESIKHITGEQDKQSSTLLHRPSTPPANSESWRSSTSLAPAPPLPLRKSSSGFVASGTIALDAAVDSKKEELEVVDFSDMEKLVDAPRPFSQRGQPRGTTQSFVSARPPRPVASDFFEDRKLAPGPDRSESLIWRRKASNPSQDIISPAPRLDESDRREELLEMDSPSPRRLSIVEQPAVPTALLVKEPTAPQDQVNNRNVDNLPNASPPGPPRTPRTQAFYKQATMSSLDDTMSRIKGAIVDMKSLEIPNLSPSEPEPLTGQVRGSTVQTPQKVHLREKWVPPARRPKSVGFLEDEEREIFDVTVVGLVHPPTPSVFRVQLPKQSRSIEFINRKQLYLFHRPPLPIRFEILSFEPPVESMNRRDLSLNDLLFRKPPYTKSKPKYRVALPRTRQNKAPLRAFGKPQVADNVISWRKPAASPPQATVVASHVNSTVDTGLETMSRSPPPGISQSEINIASIPQPVVPAPPKPERQSSIRSRPQPKMPAGSAVVVMRDSKIDVIEANVKSLVNFTVTDELEEAREPTQTMENLLDDAPACTPFPHGSSPKQDSSPIAKPPASPRVDSNKGSSLGAAPLPLGLEAESVSTNLTENPTFQPTNHQTSPWSRSSLSVPPLKESNSRGPDPEHLKALWSQPPEKTEFHPVNSLEAIPDDLTSLPFTLHEVKSEDGATPPPAPAPHPPSRMSQHEVTRAFQQVPQSSSIAARPPISPPSTNAPVARPTFQYNPLPPNGMRPAYVSYPSPSPAPGMGMMYPHPSPMTSGSPIPARMQVNPTHPPAYGQQSMWIPMMGSPAPTAMRPAPFSGPQMMPYSTPNGFSHTPAPSSMMVNQHHQGSPNGIQANRNRAMPMSPALSHSPMYPPSPMLVHAHAHPHAPVMQISQHHGYPIPAGRGQPRSDSNAHMVAQHLSSSQQQPHVLYPPTASSAPYARSAW